MTMRLAALWALLLVLSLAGCKSGEGGSCKRSTDCDEGLICAVGACAPCRATKLCRKEGRCTTDGHLCVATERADCRQSEACKKRGRCTADDGRCIALEGGCPCGCDRSESMDGELRAMPAPEAREAIRNTLATIAEREDAGYITDAMLRHRLRMRRHWGERFAASPPARPVPSSVARKGRASRRSMAPAEGLVRRHVFLAFGATTEWVRGREKDLQPSFRWWLELRNDTAAALNLALPSIGGTEGLAPARWYLEGSAGEPWDGRLEPGATRRVILVGAMRPGLRPGEPVAPTLHLGAVDVTARVTALPRWDAALR